MFKDLINQKGLSIDRLVTLCDISDKGNIKAATGTNAARQGQYSRQIKELEAFLDVELLDRNSRPSGVTEEGRELSDMSRNYLSAIENFINKCKNKQCKLTVAAGESIIQWVLMPIILPVLKKEIPKTKIIFKNRQSKDIVAGIKSGEFDIGIVRESAIKEDRSKQNKPATMSKNGMSSEYKLFIPTEFARERRLRNPISVQKFSELPFAILEGPGELRQNIEQLAKQKKVRIEPVVECSSSTQIMTLIENEQACGFLPNFAKNKIKPDTAKAFDLIGLNYKRKLCFAWNPRRKNMIEDIDSAITAISRRFK